MLEETAPTLGVGPQLVVRSAAGRLATEFVGVFGRDTLEGFLTSSYDQFAARATTPNYLVLFAERFARQRLQALARVEGLRSTAGRVEGP